MAISSKRLLCAFVFIFSVQQCLAKDGEWIPLFDGVSLNGWQINENPESWAVENGAIVTKGKRSHLFYVGDVENHDFKNFELYAEVLTKPGSNSGLYVHTQFQPEGWPAAGYELQVINSNPERPGNYVEHKMTGSIYAVRNTWRAPVKDNEWFTYRIRVQGKTIQTFINDRLICEYTEPENPWRPDDKKQRLLGSGTVAIQAHDPGSVVRFRNIKVKVLPDGLPSIGKPIEDRELDQLVTEFSNSNHPLIDIGINSPSISIAGEQANESRTYGMTIMNVTYADAPPALLVINDSVQPPDLEAMRAAKESGAKVAFSSGGALSLKEERVKARLLSLKQSGLDWSDLWVPGKGSR